MLNLRSKLIQIQKVMVSLLFMVFFGWSFSDYLLSNCYLKIAWMSLNREMKGDSLMFQSLKE